MNRVVVDDGMIRIWGSDYILVVSFGGVYTRMGLSDFYKMLKVVGSVLDPNDYYVYLRYWHNWLDSQLPGAKIREIPRLQKMLARVDKLIDKLPLWAMDPFDQGPEE